MMENLKNIPVLEHFDDQELDKLRKQVSELENELASVQDHLDLHGLTAAEARDAVDRFLTNAVRQGLRTVLIIHGRGLSSPGEPVLKSRLMQWLNRGVWRKWVMAYTSARRCDGGAGATYVLLRNPTAVKGTLPRPC